MIKKGDYDTVIKQCKNKSLQSPSIISVPSTNYEGFLGEYPWHPIYKDISGMNFNDDNSYMDGINFNHFIPYTKYIWECGNYDYSINSSLEFYLPAKELIKDMNLSRELGQFSEWKDDGEIVFIDPGVKEQGPSYALWKSDKILEWAEKNEMEIIWLIGGEKQLFATGGNRCYSRLVFNGVYRYKNGKIEGELWFNEEPSGEKI
jgi:hypothetical protein